jgi:Tfp pilus assembly protein PilO
MKQIKGFAPILLVLIILAAAYFFAYPQWTELGVNRDALAVAEAENQKIKQQEAELDNFLNQYKAFDDELEKANKVLPIKETELHEVLANLDRYAVTSGVSLINLAINEGATKATDNTIAYLDLNINATGNYPSFRTFLLQTESSLRITDILSVTLTSSDQEGTGSTLQYLMTMRVYYQK